MTVVNSSSGISARNGTTTHVIPFGFTSTAGNLLVFVVSGAVTHTNAGWTEQLQPVNSGELSVFTKTSTGDTSFTDTVNGSNYPVAWAVWEFNAGSTYVAGVGGNKNQGTSTVAENWGSALTGLPGTPVRVIAVSGDNNTGGGTPSLTSTWTAPFSLVLDQTVPASGTDGTSMNIGMATGVTATSITPNWTPTWLPAGTQGAWAFDMQQALFAISEPSAGTTFTRTVDDAVGLVDAAAVTSAFARTPADSAGLSDSLARAQSATVGDVVGLADSVTPATGYARAVSDNAGIIDTAAVQSAGGLTRTIDDSAGLADALSFARAVGLTDSAGLTDQLALGLAATINDPTGLSDSTTVLTGGAGARQVDDSAGLTDSVTYSSTQTLTDAVALTDTVDAVVAAARPVTDGAGLTDSVVVAVGRSVTITDAAGLSDSLSADKSTAGSQTRAVSDSTGLDSTVRVVLTTVRPSSGTTSRPGGGTTTRPLAGVTSRYPLVSD